MKLDWKRNERVHFFPRPNGRVAIRVWVDGKPKYTVMTKEQAKKWEDDRRNDASL